MFITAVPITKLFAGGGSYNFFLFVPRFVATNEISGTNSFVQYENVYGFNPEISKIECTGIFEK